MSWEEGGVVLERDLSDYSTKQLVEELSRREGVECIDIAPHAQKVRICAFDSSLKEMLYFYDTLTDGPCIVLKIID